MDVDILLAALGAVLTILIFSYLIGDNPLFRLALHVLVGVSVAYISVVAFQSVILPVFSVPDAADSDARVIWIISLIGLVLGALLLTRGVRGISWLGDLPVAILLGVGVGVALGGAILGTLIPQVDAATMPSIPSPPILPEILEPVGQIVAILGTLTGLVVFSYTSRRPTRRLFNRLLNNSARVGRWFVLIGLGATYGGVLVASLAILADRVQYLVEVLEKINGG